MKKNIFAMALIGLIILVFCTQISAMEANPDDQLKKNNPALETILIDNETWYLVETENDLRAIGSKDYPLSARYILNANITLSKTEDWKPIGTYDAPFTGVFDGNRFEIINLTIKDPSAEIIGLFGYAKNAQINNVTLRNPDIDIKSALQKGDLIAPVIIFGYLEDNECNNNQIKGAGIMTAIATAMMRVGSTNDMLQAPRDSSP